MTAAPELKSTRPARKTAYTPRPLPVWLQAGMVVLLLVQGVQMLTHRHEPSLAANTDQAAPSTSQERFEYYYQPDNLRATAPQARTAYDPYGAVRAMSSGSQLATFQYSGYYAHAPSAVTVTPVHAYAPSVGRWLSRDTIAEDGGINLYAYTQNDPLNDIDTNGECAAAIAAVVIATIISVLFYMEIKKSFQPIANERAALLTYQNDPSEQNLRAYQAAHLAAQAGVDDAAKAVAAKASASAATLLPEVSELPLVNATSEVVNDAAGTAGANAAAANAAATAPQGSEPTPQKD